MSNEIKNANEITFTIKYNTRQVYYEFKSNHLELGKPFNYKLASKMFYAALCNENASFFRIILQDSMKYMKKRETIIKKRMGLLKK